MEIEKGSHSTLLKSFILDRLTHYEEPQRLGTSRGEPVGLSRIKFKATLWMLFDMSKKKMAESLGVSYGLLRKWNTEKAFKEAVEKNYRDFAQYFIRHIEKRVQLRKQKTEEILSRPIEEIAAMKSDELSLAYNEYEDAALYSTELVVRISNALWEKGINKMKNDNDVELLEFCLESSNVLSALSFYSGTKPSPILEKELKRLRDRSDKQSDIITLEIIRSILSKKEMTEEAKKVATLGLSMMIQRKKQQMKDE